MLWLILGIVLLIIAIAGGAIVHPILFALAIVALVVFFNGYRGRGAAL
jgi:membrane protein implicated in regulation of membrane protease activity